MGINIRITNSEISDKAEVMNGITGSDIAVEVDRVKIDHEAKVLNDMTDAQVRNLLEQLEEQTKQLKKNGEEYSKIMSLFADINKEPTSAKRVLTQHLPGLLTGTLANVISGLLLG